MPNSIAIKFNEDLGWCNKVIHKIFNIVYDTDSSPQPWLRSTFITLPKKINTWKCEDQRLISLMGHTSKIFLKLLHQECMKNVKVTSVIHNSSSSKI